MGHRFPAIMVLAALVGSPVAASAQSSASDMKGPPNADGAVKERGMEKGSPSPKATGEKGSEERPATKELPQTPK